METDKKNEPIEVFDGTNWQAGMVKSLLENAEIEAYMVWQETLLRTMKRI